MLNWFAAYFHPGTITAGFDGLLLEQSGTPADLTARLHLSGRPERRPMVIATTGVPGPVTATWQGQPVTARERAEGTFEIQLPTGAAEGELRVRSGLA